MDRPACDCSRAQPKTFCGAGTNPLLSLIVVALAFYVLIWGTELLFPGTLASTVVLVGAAVLGVWLGRPGFNLRPDLRDRQWMLLMMLIVVGGAIAGLGLIFLNIPMPYDIRSPRSLLALLPGLLMITAIEEALFRQGMYRWLEKRRVSGPAIVATTALVFAVGHAGALILGRSSLIAFHVIQSLYLIPIGLLLGQIRRVTNSWLMSWIGHATYNATVLLLLAR